MDDYKELISVLRFEADGYLMADAPDVMMADSLNSAADAIEELLQENDALGRSLCECDDLLKKLERENRRNTTEEHDERQ